MKPYKPSNKVTSAGFQWMLLSSIIGGGAIGGVTHFVSLVAYLVILFPLCMGFAGGFVMSVAVKQGKVRNPAIAALFGAFAGVVLYGTTHGAAYLQFKQEATQQITQELGQVTNVPTAELIDAFLQEKTGDKGFTGYLKYSAQQGVSIGRIGRQGNNLGETGTWIYWLIEFLIIDIIIAAMAYAAAKSPFCESCNQWYEETARMGNVKATAAEDFLTLLKSAHFSKAGALIDPLQGVYPHSLEVSQAGCAGCKLGDRVLTVNAIAVDKQGSTSFKEKVQGLISLSDYSKLEAALRENLVQAGQSEVTPEQVQLAQQERHAVPTDPFEPHGLEAEAIADLTQQLARYPQIKTAHLVRKTLQYFPEKPFYVLGFERKPGLVESKTAESELVSKLFVELVFPGNTALSCLNKEDAMAKALQAVDPTPIYQRQK
jgi:hypothetical protein